jgi:hypothetical protein
MGGKYQYNDLGGLVYTGIYQYDAWMILRLSAEMTLEYTSTGIYQYILIPAYSTCQIDILATHSDSVWHSRKPATVLYMLNCSVHETNICLILSSWVQNRAGIIEDLLHTTR